jgi:hypothetical protein
MRKSQKQWEVVDLGNTQQDRHGLRILVDNIFGNPQANLRSERDTTRAPEQVAGIRHSLNVSEIREQSASVSYVE